MNEIDFGQKILQKENRVKIPQPIANALKIKEGDEINITLDIKDNCIKIKKAK